jgi:lysozyme
MTIFGVDVSGYQSTFDFARCRAQGFDFAVIKATEGNNYVNPSYAAQLQASASAGLLTSSYHFVHATDVPGQLAEIERYVDKRYPVWLDSEVDGAGEYIASVQLHDQARAAGWNVVGDYFPRWFWSSIGSPNLAPLGALWSSGYPTTRTGAAVDIYAAAGGDNGSGWAAYGGATPLLWQFTNAAAVSNYARIDADAFRGTRDQLAALLQGDIVITPDDAATIAKAVWGFQIANPGYVEGADPNTGPGKRTFDASAYVAYGDYFTQQVLSVVQAVSSAVTTLAAHQGMDPAVVQQTIDDAVAKALAAIHITVTNTPSA